MFDVALIDAQNHHCFQPLLYEVATAALSPADVAWPIRAILREQKNVRVIMARVTGIDVQERRVLASEIDLAYDYLVLATGGCCCWLCLSRRNVGGSNDTRADSSAGGHDHTGGPRLRPG